MAAQQEAEFVRALRTILRYCSGDPSKLPKEIQDAFATIDEHANAVAAGPRVAPVQETQPQAAAQPLPAAAPDAPAPQPEAAPAAGEAAPK